MNYLLIILYNLFDIVRIPVVGQLKLSELMAVALFPIFYKAHEFTRYPMLRKIMATLLVVLFFQMFTDIFIADTVFRDYIRGWSQTIIGMFTLFLLFKLLNNYKAITLFLLTSAISTIFVSPLGLEPTDNETVIFKFRIAPVIYTLVLTGAILLHHKGHGKIIPLLFLAFGLFCIAMDYRSRGMIMVLAAVIIYFPLNGFRFRVPYVAGAAVVVIVLFQAMYVIYANAVLNGKMGGEHALEQMERLQNPYNPLELLMTGRGETFAAVEAIRDAPVFGHGSWAKDKTLKYYKIIIKYQHADFNEEKAQLREQLVPSHSVFMGAWVNHGLGAFLAIACLFLLFMKMSGTLIARGTHMPVYPVFITLSINIAWIFLFSPFQQVRFGIPGMAAILLTSYYLLKQDESTTHNLGRP